MATPGARRETVCRQLGGTQRRRGPDAFQRRHGDAAMGWGLELIGTRVCTVATGRCGAPAEGSPRRQPWDHVDETTSPGRGGRGVGWGLAHAEARSRGGGRGAGKMERGSRLCRCWRPSRGSFAPSRLRAKTFQGCEDLARSREDAKADVGLRLSHRSSWVPKPVCTSRCCRGITREDSCPSMELAEPS